ncbi:MFS transporter [Nocardia sp. ET3-3]|uniref:MFS transporter n=1 Tax=Nocardia terrae TaxID=2675851 RepID=A0A7K1V5V2_9NOCA|nr:MFS transporter [Nocardia terrae]
MPPLFRRFLVIRAVSLAGSAMTPVALALAVLDTSGRPGDLGIVLAAQVIPHIGLLLVGGVVADRVSRRAVLLGANLVQGVTQGAVAGVLISGHYGLLVIAGLELVNGAAGAFAGPALRGIVPELVAEAALQRANSLLAGTRNATKILGPTLAGVLVATVGGGWAIAVDAASFLVAAALLAGLRLDRGSRISRGPGLWPELRAGWRTFRGIRWVWVTTVAFCLINLLYTGIWQILGPALTRQRSGDAAWGLVLGVRAVGLLVMSALMYRFAFRYLLRAGQLLGVFGGFGLLALGFGAGLPTVLGCAFVAGMGFTALDIAWEVSVQQHVPRAMLSRVSAYGDLLSYIAIPAGQLAVGPLSGRFGAYPVALAGGIAFALASLVPLLVPDVRNLPA